MSIGKKIAHKAEAAKGAAKKYFGRATGNTRLPPRDASISSRATPNRQATRSKTPSNTDRRLTTLTATTGLRCPRL